MTGRDQIQAPRVEGRATGVGDGGRSEAFIVSHQGQHEVTTPMDRRSAEQAENDTTVAVQGDLVAKCEKLGKKPQWQIANLSELMLRF
jgi:hypothetical protein